MGKAMTSSSSNAMSKLSIISTPKPARPGRAKKNKASQACAKCRANQKRCENGISRAEAEKQRLVPRSCDRCIRTGSDCIWDDTDFRIGFKSRDALTMEAQIERLQSENAILRRRLEDHGLSSEVTVEAGPLDPSDDEDSSQEDSTGRKGRQVGGDWYGGPSPFKDQDEAGPETAQPSVPRPPRSNNPETPPYYLCQSLQEVQSLDPRTAHEWLRYLPGDTVSFLSRLEHDKALRNFFAFFSDWQLRIIPHLFLRDLALATGHSHNKRIPAPRAQAQHYSPLTHNAILSVALAYSDNEHLRSREIREKFAKHAKSFLEAECRSATLSTVHGLAVLSSFHSGFAEQSLGFMYFGMGVRMAQALGLHVSAGARDPAPADSYERDYVFWSLFAQDKCWSLYVGRDHGIRAPHYDVADPLVNEDMDNTPWAWAFEDGLVPHEQPSYLSRSFVQAISLMKIAGEINDVVYSIQSYARRGGLHIGKVADLHLQLRSWEAKLPRTIRIAETSVHMSRVPPHIMMVNLAYHWLSILLLRPLFKPGYAPLPSSSSTSSGTYPDGFSAHLVDTDGQSSAKILQTLKGTAASQCPASANQIVRLFNRYDALYGLRFVAITAPQIAYMAGQVHLGMYFAATTSSAREKSHNMVLNCISILEKMGSSWVSGNVTASILRRLLVGGDRRYPKVSHIRDAPSSTQSESSIELPTRSLEPQLNTHHPTPSIALPKPGPSLSEGASNMDYTIYLGPDHSGQLPLPPTPLSYYDWNIEATTGNNPAPSNAPHNHLGTLPLGALPVPPAQLPTPAFNISIPAWLLPFTDVPEPSDLIWTWDDPCSNYPEQRQHPAQLPGSTIMNSQQNNVDPLQGCFPATTQSTSGLNTGSIVIDIPYAGHESSRPTHGHSNPPFFPEAP